MLEPVINLMEFLPLKLSFTTANKRFRYSDLPEYRLGALIVVCASLVSETPEFAQNPLQESRDSMPLPNVYNSKTFENLSIDRVPFLKASEASEYLSWFQKRWLKDDNSIKCKPLHNIILIFVPQRLLRLFPIAPGLQDTEEIEVDMGQEDTEAVIANGIDDEKLGVFRIPSENTLSSIISTRLHIDADALLQSVKQIQKLILKLSNDAV